MSCRNRLFTHIENERHVIKIELVLFLVILLKLSSVIVLTLLGYVCPHMSLLFGLEPQTQQTQLHQVHPVQLLVWMNHSKQSLKCWVPPHPVTFSTSAFVALISWSVFSAYCAARSASLHSLSNRFLLWCTKKNERCWGGEPMFSSFS